MKIGIVSRTATYWPLYLLERDGAVELVELGSTSAGIDALLERRVDIAATCPDVLIATGASVRIAAGLVDRPPAWLVARPAAATVADLRGRRVATTAPRGSVSIFLRALLRAHGLERGAYEEVVVGPTPAQAAALERGAVDAAMLTVPFDEPLAARGFRRLAHAGDTLGPCAFTTLNVREGWTRAAGDAWRALSAALAGAVARLGDEPGRERERPILADATRVAVGAAPRISFGTALDPAAVERLIALLRLEGEAIRAPAAAFLEAG